MARRAVAHGGDWTNEKLQRVRKYLHAYTTIFTANTKASYYTTWYVDAFAGTGYWKPRKSQESNSEEEELLKGSACLALEVDSPFNNYLFIEKKKSNVIELQKIGDVYPELSDRIQVVHGDANVELLKWIRRTDWKQNRAVVFLDPFGMEVTWSLLEEIAETRGVDLWLLFPLFGINRHLTKKQEPPKEWVDRVSRIFGSKEWLSEFYKKESEVTFQENLFADEERMVKFANWDRLSNYFVARLQTIFGYVAPNPLLLKNSGNAPLFLLCFAAANETASKIAKEILGRP